jgi:HprK-related kinase B
MNTSEISVPALAEQFRQAHPPQGNLYLKIAGCAFCVESNSVRLLNILRHYYQRFVSEENTDAVPVTAIEAAPVEVEGAFTLYDKRPPGKKIKEEYLDLPGGRVVRKLQTDMVFAFGSDCNLAIGPCMENANQVANFIDHLFIQYRMKGDGLLLHAAGVAGEGRGLALAGVSGSGKTTLLLHLLDRGASLVSNDRLILEAHNDEIVMHGVPKLPRVTSGTMIHHPALEYMLLDADRPNFEKAKVSGITNDKYDVYLHRCPQPEQSLSSALDELVILNWAWNNKPLEIRQVDLRRRTDLLQAVMKDLGVFTAPDDETFGVESDVEAYLDLLIDIPTWEMTGGADFPTAVQDCLDRLS